MTRYFQIDDLTLYSFGTDSSNIASNVQFWPAMVPVPENGTTPYFNCAATVAAGSGSAPDHTSIPTIASSMHDDQTDSENLRHATTTASELSRLLLPFPSKGSSYGTLNPNPRFEFGQSLLQPNMSPSPILTSSSASASTLTLSSISPSSSFSSSSRGSTSPSPRLSSRSYQPRSTSSMTTVNPNNLMLSTSTAVNNVTMTFGDLSFSTELHHHHSHQPLPQQHQQQPHQYSHHSLNQHDQSHRNHTGREDVGSLPMHDFNLEALFNAPLPLDPSTLMNSASIPPVNIESTLLYRSSHSQDPLSQNTSTEPSLSCFSRRQSLVSVSGNPTTPPRSYDQEHLSIDQAAIQDFYDRHNVHPFNRNLPISASSSSSNVIPSLPTIQNLIQISNNNRKFSETTLRAIQNRAAALKKMNLNNKKISKKAAAALQRRNQLATTTASTATAIDGMDFGAMPTRPSLTCSTLASSAPDSFSTLFRQESCGGYGGREEVGGQEMDDNNGQENDEELKDSNYIPTRSTRSSYHKKSKLGGHDSSLFSLTTTTATAAATVGVRYHQSINLSKHNRSNVKKYRKTVHALANSCPVEGCPYRFNLKRELVRHMAVHTFSGRNRYLCSHCKMGLCRLDSVKRHMEAKGKVDCLRFGYYQEYNARGELVAEKRCKDSWYEHQNYHHRSSSSTSSSSLSPSSSLSSSSSLTLTYFSKDH